MVLLQASRTDDGAERHLKVKRYEPTSEDKANARDARQRGFVLKELIQTEEVYIDTLVSLQGTIFPRLLAAGKKLTDACRDMVENFKSLVAVQTEFWGSVSVISAQKYFEEHQVVDALADFISKMPQSYTNFVSHFDSFASEVFLAEPALRDHEAQIKDVLIRVRVLLHFLVTYFCDLHSHSLLNCDDCSQYNAFHGTNCLWTSCSRTLRSRCLFMLRSLKFSTICTLYWKS
eukprot:SAG31_NODE_14_length_37953_cov_109.719660_14_plen_232_part_00